MNGITYGYIRVSSKDQNEDRQRIAMYDAGVDERQGRDLTGTLIADIVLQLLSYVAQTEREFIKQRQAEGIAAAKLRGVHLGRKPMERPDTFCTVYDEWVKGEISARRRKTAANLASDVPAVV